VGDTIDRARLLDELGYRPVAARAVEVLVAAGLTNPRKSGIAREKREKVEAALAAAFVRLCARCAADAPRDGRERVPVSDAKLCDRCGGSANRLSVDRAAAACRRRGVRRVVVVGGSPGIHASLRQLWPADLELRIVPGTDRHTGRQAGANLAWADVVLVWGATQLDHKVSLLYTKERLPKVIVAPRRGIEALADTLTEHLGSGSIGRGNG
jgi:hypothetical protein